MDTRFPLKSAKLWYWGTLDDSSAAPATPSCAFNTANTVPPEKCGSEKRTLCLRSSVMLIVAAPKAALLVCTEVSTASKSMFLMVRA